MLTATISTESSPKLKDACYQLVLETLETSHSKLRVLFTFKQSDVLSFKLGGLWTLRRLVAEMKMIYSRYPQIPVV